MLSTEEAKKKVEGEKEKERERKTNSLFSIIFFVSKINVRCEVGRNARAIKVQYVEPPAICENRLFDLNLSCKKRERDFVRAIAAALRKIYLLTSQDCVVNCTHDEIDWIRSYSCVGGVLLSVSHVRYIPLFIINYIFCSAILSCGTEETQNNASEQ
jgi:hypothetical protein